MQGLWIGRSRSRAALEWIGAVETAPPPEA
jgi:hypothetical protein